MEHNPLLYDYEDAKGIVEPKARQIELHASGQSQDLGAGDCQGDSKKIFHYKPVDVGGRRLVHESLREVGDLRRFLESHF